VIFTGLVTLTPWRWCYSN